MDAEDINVPQPRDRAGPSRPAPPASPLADPSLTAYLQKSPTLQGGLAQLNRDGINVVWGTAGGGTYIVPGSKIVIDADAMGQGGRLARSLSHEIGHHRFSEQPDQSSKQGYVSTLLRGEAAATLSNAQVRREILDRHGADIGIVGTGDRPQQYQAIADQHLAGRITRNSALNQIGDVFKTERPSVGPHATYELYYGAYYDRHIAPRQRRQGTPEPDASDQGLTDRIEAHTQDRNPRASTVTPAPTPPGLGHADHGLYGQIKAGVEKLDAQHGRDWDGASQRLTASLLALAKEQGLSRVDHVVLSQPTDRVSTGERVFLVQGGLSDPTQQRASMATRDAVNAPEVQSFEKVDLMNQASTKLNQQQSHSQSDVQDQSQAHANPPLSR